MRQEATLHTARDTPLNVSQASDPTVLCGPLQMQVSAEIGESTDKDSEQPQEATNDNLSQRENPGLSNEPIQTNISGAPANVQQENESRRPADTVDLLSDFAVSTVANEPPQTDSANMTLDDEPQARMVQLSSAAPEDDRQAETLALGGNGANDTRNPDLLAVPGPELSLSALNFYQFPSSTPQTRPTDLQNAPQKAANPSNASAEHRLQSASATPPADIGNLHGSRKRPSDANLLDERRNPTRMSAEVADLPRQLPTPQDSPQTSNITTLSERFESVLAAVRSRPLTVDIEPVIDDARIEMMRDACRRNDRFYLLAHALFCYWSATEWTVLTKLSLTTTHFAGIQLLQIILGSNRRLSKEIFTLLLTFPLPPEGLTGDTSPELRVLLEEVRCFFFHLASGYSISKDAAIKRGVPPCPAEFKYALKLPSPVLQKALFLSILRQGHNDEGWLHRALLVFEQEMDNPDGSALSIAELNAYHGAQIPEISVKWANKYSSLMEQYYFTRNLPPPMQIQNAPPVVNDSAGYNGPQMHQRTLPSSSPDLFQPLHSQSPLSPLHAPHMAQLIQSAGVHQPMRLNSSPVQAQYPHQMTLPSNSHGLHQTPYSNSHPQFQHSPNWMRASPTVSNGAQVNARSSSQIAHPQFVQQPYFNNRTQSLPFAQHQTFPLGPPATQTSHMNTSLATSTQGLQVGRPRKEWEVAKVVAERKQNGKTEFLVEWTGYGPAHNSWEPESHLRNAKDAVARFRSKRLSSTVHQGLSRPPQSNSTTPNPTRVAVVHPNSMPSFTLQRQQHAMNQQTARNVSDQSSTASQQAVQLSTTIQVPQAQNLQHRSAPQPPIHTNGPARTPSVPAIASPQTQPFVDPNHVSAQMQPSAAVLPNMIPQQGQQRQLATPQQGQNVMLQQPPSQPHLTPRQGQPFFPDDPGFNMPQMAVSDPDRTALHQAHLRSPEYWVAADFDDHTSDVRYYQFVEDIIELPEFVTLKSDLIRWNVHLAPKLWERKTIALTPVGEFLTRRRNVSSGDVQFRLKSINFDDKKGGQPKPTLSEFCTRSTKWPKCISVSVNGDAGVEFRRKAHYGVDLATDMTEMLNEGDNEIVIGVIFTPQDAEVKFLMAIEIICIVDHDGLLKMPTRIPAAAALAAITDSLKHKDDGDDDDLIVSQPIISIDLNDPFMSVIWVTPVRGSLCKHRECFDLEAFLLSRTSRVKESILTSPDQWRCPICGGDARPPMLVIDEFLLEVRKTLEEKSQLHAKAILVKEDGSWEPKVDPTSKDGARDTPDTDILMTGTSDPVAQPAMAPAVAAMSADPRPPPTNERTVIVLDDDDD